MKFVEPFSLILIEISKPLSLIMGILIVRKGCKLLGVWNFCHSYKNKKLTLSALFLREAG